MKGHLTDDTAADRRFCFRFLLLPGLPVAAADADPDQPLTRPYHKTSHLKGHLIMSHLIDQSTGAAAIAFVGDVPWHGLGSQLAAGATIDQWIDAARLNFEIGLADVAAKIVNLSTDGVPHWLPCDEYRITYRKDTGKRFAVVSKEWKPRQPREHMMFFDSLAKSHGMQLQVAGAIKEGAVIWGLASNCREITI